MITIRTLIKTRTCQLIITLVFLSVNLKSGAQITIKGPVCVTADMKYQYLITGNWNSKSNMKVLIKGGKLGPGVSSNVAGPVQSSILVSWAAGTLNQIIVVTNVGTDTLNVRMTTALNGGDINDSERFQIFRYDRSSYFFHCTKSTGGSCDPFYQYQWQQSDDGVIWNDLKGATGQDLKFSELIKVNRYFRRLTSEVHGNSKAYSEMAQLSIALP